MKYFKRKILVCLMLVMLISIPVKLINAQEGTGLEAEKPELAVDIDLEMTNMFEDENSKIQINESLIKILVESRLKKNNIKTLNKTETDNILLIKLEILPTIKERKHEYNIPSYLNLRFIRNIRYDVNDETYHKTAVTWDYGGRGIGITSRDDILKFLVYVTDIFINEFYKANDF